MERMIIAVRIFFAEKKLILNNQVNRIIGSLFMKYCFNFFLEKNKLLIINFINEKKV